MRIFLSIVAAAVLAAAAGTAQAGQKGGAPKGDSDRHERSRPYHEEHGTKFEGGYFYKGRDHHHWTYRCWWDRYGCYTYYCPSTCCWYYWYPQSECYYPVSYITTATPAPQPDVGVETGVKQIVNVTNNSPAAATVGAGAPLPPVAGPAPMPPAPPGP